MQKLLLILTFGLLLLLGCKEEAVTEPEEEIGIIISGVVSELNDNGLIPSGNAIVRLSTLCASSEFPYSYDTTDQEGKFRIRVDYPETCYDGIWLKVSKSGYGIIEIPIKDSGQTDISLQINKIVNYFPIKVGNRWGYNKYSNAGDIYTNSLEGIEIWEITSVEGQNFDVDVYFTGSQTFYYTGTPTDTLFHENLKSSYKLKISKDGYLEPQENLGDMPFWHSRGEYLIITHIMNLDGIYINNMDNWNGISYRLLMDTGIEYYEYKFFDGSTGKKYTLELLSFIEGG